ncbi:MAG: hypothetical protein ACT4TC_23090 [Myxococcaceae bacterium]
MSRQTTVTALKKILAGRRSYLAARIRAVAHPTVETARERRELETEISALEHALTLIGETQHDWQ